MLCIMLDTFLRNPCTAGRNDNRILFRICKSCASNRLTSPPCSYTTDTPSILDLQPKPWPAEYPHLPRTPSEDEKHSDSVDKLILRNQDIESRPAPLACDRGRNLPQFRFEQYTGFGVVRSISHRPYWARKCCEKTSESESGDITC